MKPHSCPDTETLLAFSEGILKSDKMRLINEHLMNCDLCLREVFLMKRMLRASSVSRMFPLPETLKEKALEVARDESIVSKTARYLSEFILSLTEKGLSYVSHLLLPEGASLNTYTLSVSTEEFRDAVERKKEAIIIEETLRDIHLKVTLLHTDGPFVNIKVSLKKEGNSVDSVRISLYQEETLLSSKLTSEEGVVEFSDLSYGYYSIRIPSEEIELRFRLEPESEGEK